MIVLHAVWTSERLHLWAEDAAAATPALAVLQRAAGDAGAESSEPTAQAASTSNHPFACDAATLRGLLVSTGLLAGDDLCA